MQPKSNMEECILAADIGTTALKAGLITKDGKVLAMCSVPYSAPENRFVAEGWLWALKAAVDKLKTGVGEHMPVDGALRQAQGPQNLAQRPHLP